MNKIFIDSIDANQNLTCATCEELIVKGKERLVDNMPICETDFWNYLADSE